MEYDVEVSKEKAPPCDGEAMIDGVDGLLGFRLVFGEELFFEQIPVGDCANNEYEQGDGPEKSDNPVP